MKLLHLSTPAANIDKADIKNFNTCCLQNCMTMVQNFEKRYLNIKLISLYNFVILG